LQNKQVADYVTQSASTAGVAEAWQQLIVHNQSLV